MSNPYTIPNTAIQNTQYSHFVVLTLALRIARSLGHRLALAWQIRGERRKLAGLSDQALHDIGIGRGQAHTESRRGLFDLPNNRD